MLINCYVNHPLVFPSYINDWAGSVGVQLQLFEVVISPKWIKQQQQPCFIYDKQGLWLCAHGLRMQPAWHKELPRLKRAGLKSEVIARACLSKKQDAYVVDATAGLGHDSLLLAAMGATVTLIERNALVWLLLKDAWHNAQNNADLIAITQRMQLKFGQAEQLFRCIAADVVYLDPMFPQDTKNTALVKKEMQVLHAVLQHDTDKGEQLLAPARQHYDRVVVKRPKHAPFLNDTTPDHQWIDGVCRCDGYFKVSRTCML